jgi:hypothetical protein
VNGHTRVTMHHDGTAYVHTGNSGQTWPKEQVQRATEVSKSCAESRKVKWPEGSWNCPCLACEVSKASFAYQDRHYGPV